MPPVLALYEDIVSGDAPGVPLAALPRMIFVVHGTVTIEERTLLPSFLYIPKEGEFPAAALALPWDKKAPYFTGEFARSHGSKVPTRLVASAKSWLSSSHISKLYVA